MTCRIERRPLSSPIHPGIERNEARDADVTSPPMRLTDILQPDCVRVPLQAATKQGVIFELVDLLSEKVGIGSAQQLKDAVWQRESTRTTGIGHGIAIPHGKSAGCPRLAMAIGLTQQPLEFGAIDGKPVSLIILLASPPDQTGPHIQALARISRMLTDDRFRASIKQATSAEIVYKLITDHETKDGA